MNESVSIQLARVIAEDIRAAGGWVGFDRFMQHALYAPKLGYYDAGLPKLGLSPHDGSDFVTAPELSPFFARALARQIAPLLHASDSNTVYEFGAGSGALAAALIPELRALGAPFNRYVIVDISDNLRARQQARLAHLAPIVEWQKTLTDTFTGVVIGNELLDALPIKLLVRQGAAGGRANQWQERGVALGPEGTLQWAQRDSDLCPPIAIGGEHDYLCEIHPQACALVRTMAEKLERGALVFIDYGFGEREYYHPERSMGTLMCHRAHRSDTDPLLNIGEKDITAHIDFTAIALAGQESGLDILGYGTQGRFLLNCGILELLEHASIAERANALKLIHEHEMGELFKVLVMGRHCGDTALGFATGNAIARL